MTQYTNEYGTTYAVREHKGSPALMCRAKDAPDWSLSGVLAAVQGDAQTADDMQWVLDEYARAHGWKPVKEPASAEPQEIVDEGSGPEDGFPDWVRPIVEEFLRFPFFRELPAFTAFAIRHREPVQHHQDGTLADGLYDTDPKGISFTVFRSDNSDQYREASYTWADFVRRCKAEGLAPEPQHQEKEATPCNTEPAPNGDAAATTAASAAPMQSTAAETTTISASGAGASTSTSQESGISGRNSSPAPGCPAETGDAASVATPAASPAATPSNLPAFDYSGLNDQTVRDLHLAEKEIQEARQTYICRVSAAVALAHEAIANCDGHNQYSRETFISWCRSVGLNKDAAYRLLQVNALLTGATPEEQVTLEAASPSLLYAAAKPSAPAELVQAVKDGDITSHKQYQDLLARYNAEKAAREKAEHEAALDRKEQEDANAAALRYKNECDRRAQDQQRLEGLVSTAQRERDNALQRATAAENRAAGAHKLAEQRGDENASLKAQIRELESRPVEVAVAQPGEDQIEAWRKEGEDRAAAALQDSVRKANQAKADAQRQVAALQDQLAAARPDADTCQRTADTLYETTENLRLLLRTQLRQAQLTPTDYGSVVAHVLQAADALRDTVRSCAPAGYTMENDEEDFL